MELTGTHLRYLLHMYEMSQREDEMRLTEIAKALHVKKSIRCADCQHFSGKTACGSAAIWETSLDSIRKRGGGAVCRPRVPCGGLPDADGAVCDAPTGDGCGVHLIAGTAGVLRRCRRSCGNLMRTSESDAYCLGSISRTARVFSVDFSELTHMRRKYADKNAKSGIFLGRVLCLRLEIKLS